MENGFGKMEPEVREEEDPDNDIAGYLECGWAVLHIASAVVWTGDSCTPPLGVAPL